MSITKENLPLSWVSKYLNNNHIESVRLHSIIIRAYKKATEERHLPRYQQLLLFKTTLINCKENYTQNLTDALCKELWNIVELHHHQTVNSRQIKHIVISNDMNKEYAYYEKRLHELHKLKAS